MLDVKDADWRILTARYAEEGSASNGLQALYSAPMFKDLPDGIRFPMAPAMDLSTKAGWEYLKMLPVPRRMRKRLYKSRAWILNMFAGTHKKHDPIQLLSGTTSSQVSGEVVVLNVDAMMDAGWNLQGEAYKALLWGAANSKVKAVIGSPPSKGLEAMREGRGTNVHDARYHKELEVLAKQLFLFLLSYTANDGVEPALAIGAPSDREGVWSTTTVHQFEEAVRDIGVSRIDLEKDTLLRQLRGCCKTLAWTTSTASRTRGRSLRTKVAAKVFRGRNGALVYAELCWMAFVQGALEMDGIKASRMPLWSSRSYRRSSVGSFT